MYCGIDISKDKSNVCILDSNKELVKEFIIDHTNIGFKELTSQISKDTIIGMEVTGSYSRVVYEYLNNHYQVYYVDSLQMKNFAKLHFINVKNDKVDAKLIALYMSFNFKKISHYRNNELKDLSRLYEKTVKQSTRYKLMFKDIVANVFPELNSNFHLRRTKAIANLLLKYPSAKEISKVNIAEIEDILNKSTKRSFPNSKKASLKIKELATNSIGINSSPGYYFKHVTQLMLHYQDLVDNLVKDIKVLLKKTPYSSLLNEWGYNLKTLGIIVGEVGDIRRFSNHKKFVKYIGLDVSEKQSGKSVSVNCFISKRGNRILRSIFYNMTLSHLRYKTEFSSFYYRLKENGKHPKKCMTAFARKLAVKCYYDLFKCHG